MGEQILWILGVNNKLIYATAKHQDNYCVVEMRSLFSMFLLAYYPMVSLTRIQI